DFADVYRKLAQTDPDILSIQVSSGLSGTINAARLGAQTVPEAKVTFFDTKTLSGAQGWHVEAAARAINAGWDLKRILAMLESISAATDTIYTLAMLKYLIHGGRISHMRGLLGSLLDIKPIIAVEKVGGTYVQKATIRSLKKGILMIPELIAKQHAPGSELRVQVMHGDNEEGAHQLRDKLDTMFRCTWLPVTQIAPVLGAHTGPGLVGAVYAAQAAFTDLP
ncbi:MAG: DegV family protein, partial [Chloroflexota bacterium]